MREGPKVIPEEVSLREQRGKEAFNQCQRSQHGQRGIMQKGNNHGGVEEKNKNKGVREIPRCSTGALLAARADRKELTKCFFKLLLAQKGEIKGWMITEKKHRITGRKRSLVR